MSAGTATNAIARAATADAALRGTAGTRSITGMHATTLNPASVRPSRPSAERQFLGAAKAAAPLVPLRLSRRIGWSGHQHHGSCARSRSASSASPRRDSSLTSGSTSARTRAGSPPCVRCRSTSMRRRRSRLSGSRSRVSASSILSSASSKRDLRRSALASTVFPTARLSEGMFSARTSSSSARSRSPRSMLRLASETTDSPKPIKHDGRFELFLRPGRTPFVGPPRVRGRC